MDIGFELRRKLFHIVVGIMCAGLVWHDRSPATVFLSLLAVGLPLSLVARDRHVPGIAFFLDVFERDHIQDRFPGRGALFFVAGALFAVLAAPREVATAAVLVVAVGDAAAHLIGVRFGRHGNPLNPEKDIEGLFGGILAATAVTALILPPATALTLSSAGILVESIDLRVYGEKVDDNITIPVAVVGGWWLFRLVAGI